VNAPSFPNIGVLLMYGFIKVRVEVFPLNPTIGTVMLEFPYADK